MLRDVPHCKSILTCGLGGLVLSVVFLTLIYPLFCNKVSEVKQVKVREYMENRFGISDNTASVIRSGSGVNEELFKAAGSGVQVSVVAPDTDAAGNPVNEDRADETAGQAHDAGLPPAKRR